MGVQYASAMGMRVVVIDTGAAKKKLSLDRGAEAFVDFVECADVAAEVKKITGGGCHGVVVRLHLSAVHFSKRRPSRLESKSDSVRIDHRRYGVCVLDWPLAPPKGWNPGLRRCKSFIPSSGNYRLTRRHHSCRLQESPSPEPILSLSVLLDRCERKPGMEPDVSLRNRSASRNCKFSDRSSLEWRRSTKRSVSPLEDSSSLNSKSSPLLNSTKVSIDSSVSPLITPDLLLITTIR